MLLTVFRWTCGIAAIALPGVCLGQAASQPGALQQQPVAGYQPNSGFPETYQQGGYFYPGVEMRALPSARAMAAAAWANFHRAEMELSLLNNDAARKFKRSAEFKKAQAEEQAAWDSLNAIRSDALAGVRQDDAYKASIDLQAKLGEQIREAKSYSTPDVTRLLTLATVKLSYAATSSAMEAAAVASDSRVKQARQRLVDASARVAELRSDYEDTVRNDPNIIAARHNLEDCRTQALAADVMYIEASRVADVGLDFAYHLYQHPYPYNNLYGYGGYGSGYLGYNGFQVGYPVNYPVAPH